MENTKIEWTDHTFNPWIGCTQVSPGCLNCYAETLDTRRLSKTLGEGTKDAPISHWGKGAPRHRTSEANWKKPLKWNSEASGPLQSFQQVTMRNGDVHRGTIPEIAKLELNMEDILSANPARPRVFCASLADWLDDEVPIEWLADLLDLVRTTPNLDWLLLTKRPQNWKERIGLAARHTRESGGDMSLYCTWGHGSPPPNVWIGTTAEDQTRAEQRIPQLLAIPAKVRFLSCEPLLGPVDLRGPGLYAGDSILPAAFAPTDAPKIHWVIAGGESGPGARPMHPDWARSLRDQCKSTHVPFFMKQMGGIIKPFPAIPDDLLIREFPTP